MEGEALCAICAGIAGAIRSDTRMRIDRSNWLTNTGKAPRHCLTIAATYPEKLLKKAAPPATLNVPETSQGHWLSEDARLAVRNFCDAVVRDGTLFPLDLLTERVNFCIASGAQEAYVSQSPTIFFTRRVRLRSGRWKQRGGLEASSPGEKRKLNRRIQGRK